MPKSVQSIRGMNDILPAQTPSWRWLETRLQSILMSYGYEEIRMPVVEHTELFSRSIGEVTDIVEKEMYTFEDRNGDSLTLRPEGTAGCVRAGIQHGLLHNQQQRLWYMGPIFRHERPQRGRYRQFHQIGVECFGIEGPDIDAELIIMTARMWQALGIDNVRLEINSIGTPGSRAAYRQQLVDYFSAMHDQLDEDSKRRLHTNPLRILDSKNPDMKDLIMGAPGILDALDGESQRHFEGLMSRLDEAGLEYVVNQRLVRGLDYYSRTVFEWVSEELGAQGTICAGGRYDDLVEQLGGRPTNAVGFAIGLERLQELVEQRAPGMELTQLDIYLVALGVKANVQAMQLSDSLRDEIEGVRIMMNCGGGSFKAQFKRADRSGARLALILGEDEVRDNTVGVKFLREDTPQESIDREQLAGYLRSALL